MSSFSNKIPNRQFVDLHSFVGLHEPKQMIGRGGEKMESSNLQVIKFTDPNVIVAVMEMYLWMIGFKAHERIENIAVDRKDDLWELRVYYKEKSLRKEI